MKLVKLLKHYGKKYFNIVIFGIIMFFLLLLSINYFRRESFIKPVAAAAAKSTPVAAAAAKSTPVTAPAPGPVPVTAPVTAPAPGPVLAPAPVPAPGPGSDLNGYCIVGQSPGTARPSGYSYDIACKIGLKCLSPGGQVGSAGSCQNESFTKCPTTVDCLGVCGGNATNVTVDYGTAAMPMRITKCCPQGQAAGPVEPTKCLPTDQILFYDKYGNKCPKNKIGGCDEKCNSTAVIDCKGVCGGGTIVDCKGICGGGAVVDCAGVCNGSSQNLTRYTTSDVVCCNKNDFFTTNGGVLYCKGPESVPHSDNKSYNGNTCPEGYEKCNDNNECIRKGDGFHCKNKYNAGGGPK